MLLLLLAGMWLQARLRRHLHNLIQQLKGNVRVCVRVRPMIGDEPATVTPLHPLLAHSPHTDKDDSASLSSC